MSQFRLSILDRFYALLVSLFFNTEISSARLPFSADFHS
jgi:hypothetical protein